MSTIQPNSSKEPPRRKALVWLVGVAAAIAVIGGLLYAIVVPGLSSALNEPPAAETLIAT
jgi:hypothetical protein